MKDVNPQSSVNSYHFYLKLNEIRVSEGGSKIRHDDFLARVEDECEELGVCENFVHPQNKQPMKVYWLNEDQMLLVGMRESKAVRKKVLSWLKSLKPETPAFQIPQTLAEALQLAADQAKQLELQAPKVAFVEKLVERENLLNATQVAQPHKLSAVKLNRILDDVGGIYNKSVKRGRAFCQAWIDAGYGELKVTESGHNQCLFTVKGEQRINEILISEGVV